MRIQRAVAAFFFLVSLPAFGDSGCAAPGSFSIDRDLNGHVLLTRYTDTWKYNSWTVPVATVNGTKIEVTQSAHINDGIEDRSCQASTVDLGFLPEASYDVDWALSGFMYPGFFSGHTTTSFMNFGPALCGRANELLVIVHPYAPRTSSQTVQIDVSELTRAAEYDQPSVTRNGSHFTIQQTERINSIALIETQAPYVCHTRTFILGTLPEGDYDAVINQPIDDAAGTRTVSATVSFRVWREINKQRSVRH